MPSTVPLQYFECQALSKILLTYLEHPMLATSSLQLLQLLEKNSKAVLLISVKQLVAMCSQDQDNL